MQRFIALVASTLLFSASIASAQHLTVSSNLCLNLTSDLAMGAKSSDVMRLQQFLIDNAFLSPQYATGYFGPLTQQALRKYQTARSIVPTGIATAATRAAIQLATCGAITGDFPQYVPMFRGLFGPTIIQKNAFGMWASIVDNEFSSSFTTTVDWGDGSQSEPQTITAQAAHAQLFNHIFTQSGNYTVVFKVTNPAGKVNTSTIYVTVQ